MNFVGEHPRLISVMAALGVSFTFSLVGKTLIHEILQPVYAIPPTPCIACGASEFTPGNEQILPGDAHNLVPSELAKSPGDAQLFAPGKEALAAGDIGPPKKISYLL
jgi:hypothetical protein